MCATRVSRILSSKFDEPNRREILSKCVRSNEFEGEKCSTLLAGIELSLELMKVDRRIGGGGGEKVCLETTHDSIWTFNIDNWHSDGGNVVNTSHR